MAGAGWISPTSEVRCVSLIMVQSRPLSAFCLLKAGRTCLYRASIFIVKPTEHRFENLALSASASADALLAHSLPIPALLAFSPVAITSITLPRFAVAATSRRLALGKCGPI